MRQHSGIKVFSEQELFFQNSEILELFLLTLSLAGMFQSRTIGYSTYYRFNYKQLQLESYEFRALPVVWKEVKCVRFRLSKKVNDRVFRSQSRTT